MKFFAIFQSFREGGFIRSFFLTARRTNPEGLPFFINPSVLRPPPLYFALQNTGEECGYIHCRRAEVFSALPPPRPTGTPPIFLRKHPVMLRDTAGRELSLLLPVFSTPPSLRATSSIFCITKHRGGGLKCHAMP